MSDEKASEKQKIIAQIEKLLALSKSPNEFEAMSAAEKAQTLLAKYNLTVSDLGNKHDPMIRDSDLLTFRSAWIRPLMHQTALTYFCGYYFEVFPASFVEKVGGKPRKTLAGGKSRGYLRHNFIGEQHNVIAAKHIAEYLVTTAERLCLAAEKPYPKEQRKSFRYSFMNACAARLCARLHERRLKASRVGISEGGTNLPALLSLYEETASKVAAYMKANVPKAKESRSIMNSKNREGLRAGYEAGNSIGLDEQIEADKPEGYIEAA